METADEIITMARQRSQLSRAELARRSNTTRAALLEYEKGIRTPRFDTLVRLLDATGTQIAISMPSAPDRADAGKSAPSLSAFAAGLGNSDDDNWRLLISDFVANDFVPASRAQRSAMLDQVPEMGERPRWDLFVVALAEHLAFHAELSMPPWVVGAGQSLAPFWWPVHGQLASQRASAMAWSPASFRRRGILIDGRELPIVTR